MPGEAGPGAMPSGPGCAPALIPVWSPPGWLDSKAAAPAADPQLALLGPDSPRGDDRRGAHVGQEVEGPLIGDAIADHHRQHGGADVPPVVDRLVSAGR